MHQPDIIQTYASKSRHIYAYLGEQRGEEEIFLLIPRDNGAVFFPVLLLFDPILLQEPMDGFLQQLNLLPPPILPTNTSTITVLTNTNTGVSSGGHVHADRRGEEQMSLKTKCFSAVAGRRSIP
jgi:hypothetical protein